MQALQRSGRENPKTLHALKPSNPGHAQVNSNEVLQGLVMPAASYALLGKGGAVLVIVICFMAVTSSGASEMVAVSSLFTFDIYRKYINPKVCMFYPPPYPRVRYKALVVAVHVRHLPQVHQPQGLHAPPPTLPPRVCWLLRG